MKANLFAFLILSALTLLTVSAVGATSTAPESASGADLSCQILDASFGPNQSCQDPELVCGLQQWHPNLSCLTSANQCYESQEACEADYGVGNCRSILNPPIG